MNHREAVILNNIEELLKEKDYLENQIGTNPKDKQRIDEELKKLYSQLKH